MIPIPNTQTQKKIDTQKDCVLGIGYGYDAQKIVYCVLSMGIIPIPNTHTQYTQFLGVIYNFGFGYWVWVHTQTQIFLCVNVWGQLKVNKSFEIEYKSSHCIIFFFSL